MKPTLPEHDVILTICQNTGKWIESNSSNGVRQYDAATVQRLIDEAYAAGQKDANPLEDDIQSILFEVETQIGNGGCPWQIEAAFEAYEAARRLQLTDHEDTP